MGTSEQPPLELSALDGYFTRLLSPNDQPDLQSKVKSELDQVPREMAPQVMREGMATDGSESLARPGNAASGSTMDGPPVKWNRTRARPLGDPRTRVFSASGTGPTIHLSGQCGVCTTTTLSSPR